MSASSPSHSLDNSGFLGDLLSAHLPLAGSMSATVRLAGYTATCRMHKLFEWLKECIGLYATVETSRLVNGSRLVDFQSAD